MAEEGIRIDPPLPIMGGMAASGAASAPGSAGAPDPVIRVSSAAPYMDITTIFAIAFSVAMIAIAILMGNTNANFFDIPSVLIVILGTIAVTCISYTGRELRLAGPVINGSFQRMLYDPARVANELLDLAVVARRRGILQLFNFAGELQKNPFLYSAIQMVTDGMAASEIDRLINQDIDMTQESYRKAAGILRRASEIAPAMGLIGTLIGLVQMLVSLNNPAAIGPAMALALLTTFYGAVMGSMILGPLAAKLERNANEDVLIKSLIHAAALSIVTQENPRKLETELNSLLPPDQRIVYFKF